MAKFKIKKNRTGQFYFVLLAKNNEVILTSEMYKSIQGAKKGITSIKKNAPKAEIVVEI